MEATIELNTILEQERLTMQGYEALREQAFATGNSLNRFRGLLAKVEVRIAAGEERPEAGAMKLGMCYLLVADPGRAAQWLERAERGAQRSYFLGQAHRERREFKEASLAFEQAGEGGWDGVECECLRAECLALMGEKEQAAAVLEAQRPDGEGHAHWHFAKGRLAEVNGDWAAATSAHEEALARDERHVRAMFHLAYLLDLHGSDDEAEELYQACCELPCVHADALINLAVIYEDRGQFEKASQCLRRVLAVNPRNARAQLYLKDVLAASDMYIDEQHVKEQEERDAILDIPVSDFELSVRSRNCLKKMNIHTLGDLLRATESELLAYKNFGETSLKEIKAMLDQKSLALGQYARETGAPPATPAERLPPGDPEVLLGSVAALNLSVRSRKCLQRLGINTVSELIARSEIELLESRNFGQTSLSEIKDRLADIDLSLRPAT